jgi:hypothetical protein
MIKHSMGNTYIFTKIYFPKCTCMCNITILYFYSLTYQPANYIVFYLKNIQNKTTYTFILTLGSLSSDTDDIPGSLRNLLPFCSGVDVTVPLGSVMSCKFSVDFAVFSFWFFI